MDTLKNLAGRDHEDVIASEQEKQNAFEMLVKRASACERQALVELCESIAKEVLYRVTRNVGDPTNSEDISQEVLIRICENIRYLREPKAFRAWLSKIVKNEVNRYYKLNSRYNEVLDIDHYLETVLEEKREFLPHEFAENTEERSVITDAVSRLSSRQKQAVMLHYYDDLSVTEVAEAMTVTKQSVSEFLAISREKIKRELSEKGFTNV